MPTADRRPLVRAAIAMFLEQEYSDKELVIVDDGLDPIGDIVPADVRIRYVRQKPGKSLGAKRNLACAIASGRIIFHWDDDDWYAPWRLSFQLQAMETGIDACGVSNAFFVNSSTRECWEYVHLRKRDPWVWGATMCFRKSLWESHPFPDVDVGEDTQLLMSAYGANIVALEENRFFLGRIHALNRLPRRPFGLGWRSQPIEVAQRLLGNEWEEYFGPSGLPLDVPQKIGTALVSAAGGIGDILRVTPLIRAVHRLGYHVDVLIAPDDPKAAELLHGAREIDRLITSCNRIGADGPPLYVRDRKYDLATFTDLSSGLGGWVSSVRTYKYGLRSSDSSVINNIAQIAHEIGWRNALPAPFAMKSNRRFDLPRDTIALHPGCKVNWPWKRWHGFDHLAALFPNVVVVGMAPDSDNSGTYFKHTFRWPANAQDFTNMLSIRDTAALLSQCAAIISNDSGIMHLGVALGVPTFGIFGLTSPQFECIPSPFMKPVTKGLPCEGACHSVTRYRRNCPHNLECLITLRPEEVAECVLHTLRPL